VTDDDIEPDPRVQASQEEWRRVRRHLNANRQRLARTAATLYDPAHRLGDTGLIFGAGWSPDRPVDVGALRLDHRPDLPAPVLDGAEPQTGHVRPLQTLVRPYPRYTHAIRDLARPRLFENRTCWRLASMAWCDGKGELGFGDTTYFAATDCFEAASHELALVACDDQGHLRDRRPTMRDLPFRRLIGNPFDPGRRPLMTAVSTLTVRRGDPPTFILHQRDPRSVTIAGGMLQVIPSGIFQPASIVPASVEVDFDVWRNIMREYSEELLGNSEHDGDGMPVDYVGEPFASLDAARDAGRVRVWCLGVGLDALSLVGEILTVAVWDADLFDGWARGFRGVERRRPGGGAAGAVHGGRGSRGGGVGTGGAGGGWLPRVGVAAPRLRAGRVTRESVARRVFPADQRSAAVCTGPSHVAPVSLAPNP
jgi:hypothetical protein